MCNATTIRKRMVNPAKCEVEVIQKPIYHCTMLPQGMAGIITLNGQAYYVQCLGSDPRDGYRFVKVSTGDCWDCDTSSGHPVCDCADFTFNDRNEVTNRCKHGLALVELRRRNVI